MAEDFDLNEPLPEESTNRTFVIAAAGLGAVLILSMVCLALYALVLAPRQREARIARQTEIALENTQVAQQFTQTAQATRATATEEPTETSMATATDTPTQVVVIPTDTPTSTPFTTLPTAAPLTQTAQAAGAGVTPTATPTALPSTGFAEDVGLPGLFGLAGVLLVVILVSRRLRASASTS